ncbi:peptidase [Streptomyces olivochromogenes]|uniref:Peptidase n=1 Tax=Streptomyces olivochromogenes TaxID=1963 RepID=A0A250VJJ7_STROL|nr:peptidase [Streptomyces olivochromogenes]KUN42939.1 hypothetical protein AQJ27_33720 [Streptomyces olivochromogenes]GAX54229.1 hypothetical protein SO3561_05768 [Streptomyces olivochromogenes]
MSRFIPARVLAGTAIAVSASVLAPSTSTAVPAPRSPHGTHHDPGSIGIRLVDVPAKLADDPRAREYIIDNLLPGTIIHRRIRVVNKSTSTQHVDVYPGAAAITHGSFIGARGGTRNDVTTWTKLGHSSLDIPEGGTADDTVTIAVPADAAPGERYAVLWAQVSDGHGADGVRLVTRTGIRLYLSVGGDNPRSAAFKVNTMTAARNPAGDAIVVAQVHNTGGRAVDLSGTLNLSKVSGNLTAGPYKVKLGTTLAPGQSEPVTVPVTDQVANGPWNATIDLKSGLLDETAHARITFPDTPGIAAAVAVTSPRTPTRPVLIGVVVAAFLLGTATLLTAARLRRRRGST